MKFPGILLVILCITFSCQNFEKQENTTYYLIRHAEKVRGDEAGEDPLLTEKGLERADFWATYFEDKKLDAVYSTATKRTFSTAEPTAKEFDLEVESYDSEDLFDQEFQEATYGKRVLIVGHSNTTPQFVNKIIGNNRYGDIHDGEFGAVFKVTLIDGKASVEKETINSWDKP